MLPDRITLSNYRAFPGPQELELRPITLLYGHNSAGKSALLRALPLLADSIDPGGRDALRLGERLRSLEQDFDSLRWMGRTEEDDRWIGISLGWDDDRDLTLAEYGIWEEQDWRRLVVDRLRLIGPGDEWLAEWRITRGEKRQSQLTYHVGADAPASKKLSFGGLLPEDLADDASPLLRALRDRLLPLAESTLWLKSLRPPPKRTTTWIESARWNLDPSGRDAPIVLAGFPELREGVSRWYEDNLGVQLIVDDSERKREVRLRLRNQRNASFDLDLIDAGEGLGQVLPVLTALAMAEHADGEGNPCILAIEEPEAHLHPDLQLALAQRMVEVVRQASPKPRLVIETHSQFFLLAMQRAILQDRIDEDDVILYWVDQRESGKSVAEAVTLSDEAFFDARWPDHAFEEDLDVAAEIQRLREEGSAS